MTVARSGPTRPNEHRPGVLARLARYARLWRSLPAEERNVRTARLLERTFRRKPALRRLGIVADWPRRASLRRALTVDLPTAIDRLRRPGPRRGPLHGDLAERARRVAQERPDHVRETIDRTPALLDRRFDLLGSGPVRPLRADGGIDWHRDFKSGAAWDAGIFHLDVPIVRGDGSDIKVPWELSRFQHVVVLGQAYLLAGHVLDEDEARSLRRRCAVEVRDQIDDWITRNPRGLGPNWACTMDVAIRAYNWLAALALFREAPELDDRFMERLLGALWAHGRHIRGHLEIGGDGLTSNHYLADVVGLYALGCALPELREAEGWRAFGRRALEREIERQVLADGVDFERSIPYHRLVAEMFLHGALLARARGDELSPLYECRLKLMLEFVASYTRPDGTAPQWGDNDDGRLLPLDGYASPRPDDHRHLLATGGRLLDRADLVASGAGREVEALWLVEGGPEPGATATGPRAFADGGYYVLGRDDLHLATSCGPVGTRGVGNHTHNDLLAVCVWAGGREWVTDPGTGTYSSDADLRNRLRSTSAHATVQVGCREQNPFGRGIEDLFLMRSRARPDVLEWSADDDEVVLAARHDGFGEEGAERPHRREVRFRPELRCWTLTDTVEAGSAAPPEPAFLRFPLPPGVEPTCDVPQTTWLDSFREAVAQAVGTSESGRLREAIRLDDGSGRGFWILLDLPPGTGTSVETAPYSPRYGVCEEGRVIVAELPAAGRIRAVSVLHAPGAPR